MLSLIKTEPFLICLNIQKLYIFGAFFSERTKLFVAIVFSFQRTVEQAHLKVYKSLKLTSVEKTSSEVSVLQSLPAQNYSLKASQIKRVGLLHFSLEDEGAEKQRARSTTMVNVS